MAGILDKIDKTVSILDQTVARLQGVNYRGSSNLAETKAMQVMNYARKYEHPLQVQLEKE